MTRLKKYALVGSVGFVLANHASAETYRASTWQPEGESTSEVTNTFLLPEITKRTGGAIDFEFFSGGALMPAKAHLDGIGNGIAHMGFHSSGYTPSDLPLSNALSGFGYIEPDPTTIGFAWADWLMHDSAAIKEYADHNVVALGGFSTPAYPVLCTSETPIISLDDIQGKKIRVPGGLTSALAQHVGAIPVNIPAPEIYQALQTGQIDCAGIVPLWLNIDNTLDEVVNSVTLLDWTGGFTSPIHLYNKDWWHGLTNDERQILIDLAGEASAKLQTRFTDLTEMTYETAASKGVKIVKPDASLTDKVAEWVANGVGDMAGLASSTYGIKEPQVLFDSFTPYITKWQGLLEGVDRTDEPALAKLVAEHMVGDLNPATFAMN